MAWAYAPEKHKDGFVFRQRYNCDDWCGRPSEPRYNENRRTNRCALPGFDTARWEPLDPAVQRRHYMGRLPIYGEPTLDDDVREDLGESVEHPPDSALDGCPGSWYRSQFAVSILKYERTRTESGFSANVLLDRCDDRLVLEATQFVELERVRASTHHHAAIARARAKG